MYRLFLLLIAMCVLFPSIATSKKAWRKKHYIENEYSPAIFSLDSTTAIGITININIIRIYKTNDAGNIWNSIYEYDTRAKNESYQSLFLL
jgi:hypothetical protein